MKDHEKKSPNEGHQPPPPPEKHKREKRRRRRGPSLGSILLLLFILAVATFVILWKNGLIHIGKEAGQGAGEGGTSVVESSDMSVTSVESSVVEVKVDNDKIFLDGKEIANANELKEKITEIGDKKTYNFVHEGAIKATYDEVKSVLSELERALSIKVDYNDTSE